MKGQAIRIVMFEAPFLLQLISTHNCRFKEIGMDASSNGAMEEKMATLISPTIEWRRVMLSPTAIPGMTTA